MNYVPGTAPADKTMLSPAYLWANSNVSNMFRSFYLFEYCKNIHWTDRPDAAYKEGGSTKYEYVSTMLLLITVLFGLVIAFGFVYGSDPIGL